MTCRSRPVAIAFSVITASQLAFGIYLVFLAATHPGELSTLSVVFAYPLHL